MYIKTYHNRKQQRTKLKLQRNRVDEYEQRANQVAPGARGIMFSSQPYAGGVPASSDSSRETAALYGLNSTWRTKVSFVRAALVSYIKYVRADLVDFLV